MQTDRRALTAGKVAVFNRGQFEALYGAPVETVADTVAVKGAFLPG
ncbi:MAG: hypothetical protein NTV56_12125 [Alphaproteobacteria bacterium]|nr:hypothetical protein [Alphaproteobacteria bacterium]